MMVNIYLDSSVRQTRQAAGVVGFVLEAGKRTMTRFGTVENVTRNASYLIALKNALSHIRGKQETTVWTDSPYLYGAFCSGWLEGWIDRDWKTTKGEAVANEGDWKKVLELTQGIWPVIEYQKDHAYKTWLRDEVERRAKKHV